MARKVFISVLGTGNYQECTYKKGEFELRTRFVQQATIEYFQSIEPWGEDSDIYILLTKGKEGSREKNWEVSRDFKGDIVNEHGLKDVLSEMNLKSKIHDVDIDDGNTIDELWSIFNTVFALFNEDEEYEVYFDLTHGFRYLPMLVLVLGNYLKFLRNIEVKGIVYGNYEASKRGTQPGPIIDLLPLSLLQDWTFAAASFVENGDITRLVTMSNDGLKPFLKESKGKDVSASQMRGFITNLESFILAMKLCRGVELHDGKSYQSMMKSDKSESRIAPLRYIISNILKSLDGFKDLSPSRFQLQAASWCYHKGLYQQAITAMLEGIVTFFCDRYSYSIKEENDRNIVYAAFAKRGIELWNANVDKDIRENGKTNKKRKVYEPSLGKDEVKVEQLAADKYLENERLVLFFENLRGKVRNDINHGGMRPSPLNAKGIVSALKDVDEIVGILSQDLPLDEYVPVGKPRLFINLTNHPSDKWSEKQLRAAEQYGEIEDIPFPMVDPNADEGQMKKIADTYTKLILEEAATSNVTVHVMGEMGVTYAIVKRLQSHGIKCVMSTSERISEDLPDGTRKVGFNFIRFREYGC